MADFSRLLYETLHFLGLRLFQETELRGKRLLKYFFPKKVKIES